MRLTRMFARLLAGTLMLLAVPVVVAPQARAEGGLKAPGASAPPASGPVRKTVKSCRLYASQSGFGMRCGSLSGDGSTVKEILGGDPLPDCWHEPLPEELVADYAELRAAQLAAGEKGDFWLETCMKGIDPVTLRVTGEVTFTEEVVWVPEGTPVITLTRNQQVLVAIEAKSARIPLPSVATSPAVRPRVQQDVSFRVVNDVEAGPVTYSRNGTLVEMRARLVHLRIVPQPGATAVNCPSAGVEVTATDTRATRPDGCWFTYPRSSAAQPGRTYEVRAVTSWTVEYSTGGAWIPMATIEKEQITLQPVTEVQTLVVS